MLDRYERLVLLAETIKPKVIVEIGTYMGNTAKGLIDMAKKYHEKPVYFGFDSFEPVGSFELPHHNFPVYNEVLKKLESTGAEIHLIKGNTRDTLKTANITTPDFVYIDGGHSLETIKNDWEWVSGVMGDNTMVVFDDYYVGDTTKGAKLTVDSLKDYKVEFLEPPDYYPNKYTVYMVKVTK